MELHATCYCYWNVDIPGVSVIGPWLREHVAHRPPCTGGRSVILQLGTLFSTAPFARTVPAYLKTEAYDDPAMIQAFARMWNQVAAVLSGPEFNATRLEGGRVVIDLAEFVVSIGNEVDIYLDAPYGVDGEREEAWPRYAAFYAKAADWVRGRPVDLDADGVIEDAPAADGIRETNPGPVRFFTRSVTFSSTWRICSPGWRIAHPLEDCGPTALPLGSYAEMGGRSDFWSFTRYVPYEGYEGGTEDVYGLAKAEAAGAFADMRSISELAQQVGVTAVARPILLQELGFPSSRFAAGDNLLEQQQADYVAGTFDAWTEYNAGFVELSEWWRRAGAGEPFDLWDSPFSRPRLLAFNWFMLHDFSDPSVADPNHCPFSGTDHEAQWCSWGLHEGDGTPKAAAAVFAGRSQAINPPERDPDRSCQYQ